MVTNRENTEKSVNTYRDSINSMIRLKYQFNLYFKRKIQYIK